MMKKTAVLLLGVFGLWGTAASPAQEAVSAARELRAVPEAPRDDGPTPLHLFRAESSYVFPSQLENGTRYGDQDALQSSIEYSHRFLITGKIYLRAGVSYDRFDFGRTSGPVPEQLHSLAAVVSLEYVLGKEVGAFLQIRPGYYAEGDFDSSSFDVPITLGRAFVLQPDRLYLFVGASAAFLRSEFPVIPLGGIIWRASEQWTVYGMLPEPRIIYSPTRRLDLWAGGQLAGGSFRMDDDPDLVPQRLSGARLNYTEFRAGLGLEFRCTDAIAFNLGGGYAFQRRFNFKNAGADFETEPAPYFRAALKAEF